MMRHTTRPLSEERDTRRRLRVSLYLAIIALTALVTSGTVIFRHLEGWSWISSFYFTVSTLTTVGYGDLVPTNEWSRLFTALFIVAGVAMSLAALTVVGSNYLEFIERRILRERWTLRSSDPHARGGQVPPRGTDPPHPGA